MNYTIVPIAEEHIEGCRAAVDSVARERKYLAMLEGPLPERSRAFVLEQIEKNMPHFVALHEGKVVGWCDISPLNRPVWAHCGVLGMGIIAQYRGHGVGEALMRATLDKAKAIGLTRVELGVRETNAPAIALYRKMGFEIEGIKRNATRIDGVYENDLWMAVLFE